MIEIKLTHIFPNAAMDIVRELRASGLIQGKDFDFSVHPAKYENGGFECVAPRYTSFKFYTDAHATMFALKYASYRIS